MQARICLIDDEEGIRDSLEALFGSRRLRVTSFSDGARFLSIWNTSELREVPAVFLMDVRMPGMSGLEVFREMKSQGVPAHNAVIFLTGHGDVPLAVEAIKGGALEFLEKPFSDNSLVDRVIAGMRHVERIFEEAERMPRSDSLLTPREKQIADLIVRGLTNRDIGSELNVGVRTVEVHRARIFEKLGVRNAVELVPIILRQKYGGTAGRSA
jgi:two-component system response regulator DctR